MSKVILYIDSDERVDGREGDRSWSMLVDYDPRDPASLQRARESVRQHFSLNYMPVLCHEPEPSLFDKLVKNVGRWFNRGSSRYDSNAPSCIGRNETMT